MLWTDKSNMSSENLAKDLEPFQMPCGVKQQLVCLSLVQSSGHQFPNCCLLLSNCKILTCQSKFGRFQSVTAVRVASCAVWSHSNL